MQKRLLNTAFVSVVTLGAVHLFASYYYVYWTWRWFDNIVHFLGGLAVGFLVLWFWSLIRGIVLTKKEIVLITIIGVMIIGVGWEIFEYTNGIANPSVGETYIQDTTRDLIADFVGAIVASFWAIKVILFKNE